MCLMEGIPLTPLTPKCNSIMQMLQNIFIYKNDFVIKAVRQNAGILVLNNFKPENTDEKLRQFDNFGMSVDKVTNSNKQFKIFIHACYKMAIFMEE